MKDELHCTQVSVVSGYHIQGNYLQHGRNADD